MAHQVMVPVQAQDQRYIMTYEEFLTKIDEHAHAEWVEGEVTVFAKPTIAHQQLRGFLSTLLVCYVHTLGLGEILVAPCEMRLLPGRSSREPDILLVSTVHRHRLTEDRLEGPADLVIELLSDSSIMRDRDRKFYEYQEAGIPEYWVFDPRPGKQRADFYQLSAAGKYEVVALDDAGRYHSAVLPGFWLRPEWAWQDPQPDYITLLLQIDPGLVRAVLQRAQVDE